MRVIVGIRSVGGRLQVRYGAIPTAHVVREAAYWEDIEDAAIPERLDDDAGTTGGLGPMEVSILLHAYCEQPMMWSSREVRAAGSLLKKGLICKRTSKGSFPYFNSAAAHELVVAILSLTVPEAAP